MYSRSMKLSAGHVVGIMDGCCIVKACKGADRMRDKRWMERAVGMFNMGSGTRERADVAKMQEERERVCVCVCVWRCE